MQLEGLQERKEVSSLVRLRMRSLLLLRQMSVGRCCH